MIPQNRIGRQRHGVHHRQRDSLAQRIKRLLLSRPGLSQ